MNERSKSDFEAIEDSYIKIRFALLGESSQILKVWNSVELRPSVTDNEQIVDDIILNENTKSAIFVADFGGSIIGTLIVGTDGWRGYMHRLAVLEEFRRERIASRLVDQAENWLSEQGTSRISILTVGENEIARDFWKSKDYCVDEEVVRWTKELRPTSPETFITKDDEIGLDRETSYGFEN